MRLRPRPFPLQRYAEVGSGSSLPLLPSEKYAQSIGQASGVSVAKCAKSGYQSGSRSACNAGEGRRVECCPGGEKPCKRVARDGAADAGPVGFAAFPLDLGNDFFFQQAKLVLGASRKGGIVGKQAGAFQGVRLSFQQAGLMATSAKGGQPIRWHSLRTSRPSPS